jgi:hypothetical protein
MSYHKLTYHAQVNMFIKKWGLGIYFEAISYGMLSMLCYGMLNEDKLSNAKLKMQRKWRKEHCQMNRWYIGRSVCASVSVFGTLRWVPCEALSDEPTIHFLDAPDELPRRKKEDWSVRWTYGPWWAPSVYQMSQEFKTETIWSNS